MQIKKNDKKSSTTSIKSNKPYKKDLNSTNASINSKEIKELLSEKIKDLLTLNSDVLKTELNYNSLNNTLEEKTKAYNVLKDNLEEKEKNYYSRYQVLNN